jgi:cell division septum initiation protein DivIVA
MESADEAVPFLDPESSENPAAVAVELRERLLKLEEQVLGQYSSTAAYATLAQQQAEQARAEARADHERLQTTIIGLLDRLRVEMNKRLDDLEARPAHGESGVAPEASARLAELEEKTNVVITALHAFGQENVRLRKQVDDLLARQMQSDGWLASSGSASELALL